MLSGCRFDRRVIFHLKVQVEDAMDSVLDQRHVEIDEKTQGKFEELQVSLNLDAMHGLDTLNCLQFDEKLVTNDEVQPVGVWNGTAAVDDGHFLFAFERDLEVVELNGQALMIGAFQ